MIKYKSDFVIITAIPVEFDQLKKAITKSGGNIQEIKDSSGIYQGRISSAEKSFLFYASCQLYPGMVSAATLATKMIEHYRPRYIVMLGIAAGFRNESMTPGSVLIADFVANYQQGKTSKQGFQRDVTTLPLDPILRGLLIRSKDEIINELNNEIPLPRNLKAYIGPMVTGNQVIASQEIMDGLKNSYRKVVGVEMEGFAIFQAAAEASAPKPSPILIKSVCDFGDEDKTDDYHQLAAYTSAQFFIKFALNQLETAKLSIDKPLSVKVIPWQYQKKREEKRLAKLLDKCEAGSVVKFISITGKTFLAPEPDSFIRFAQRDHFEAAIQRGVKFQGILLDPRSVEAGFRSEIESPKPPRDGALLIRDAASVKLRLENVSDNWRKNLQICYTQVGLAFKLWLFEDEAYIEPYHFGKESKDRSKPESPLCGFSHIWIEKSAPEYDLLKDHFDKIWSKCKGYWPDMLEDSEPGSFGKGPGVNSTLS